MKINELNSKQASTISGGGDILEAIWYAMGQAAGYAYINANAYGEAMSGGSNGNDNCCNDNCTDEGF